MKEIIIPMTKKIKGPLLAFVPEEHRGPPRVFVSHAWSAHVYTPAYKFGTLQAVSPQELRESKKSSFGLIWFATISTQTSRLHQDMAQVIGKIGRIAFPITPTPLFDRIWCLWELLCAAKSELRRSFAPHPATEPTSV